MHYAGDHQPFCLLVQKAFGQAGFHPFEAGAAAVEAAAPVWMVDGGSAALETRLAGTMSLGRRKTCFAVADRDKTCAAQMQTLNPGKGDSVWKRRTPRQDMSRNADASS